MTASQNIFTAKYTIKKIVLLSDFDKWCHIILRGMFIYFWNTTENSCYPGKYCVTYGNDIQRRSQPPGIDQNTWSIKPHVLRRNSNSCYSWVLLDYAPAVFYYGLRNGLGDHIFGLGSIHWLYYYVIGISIYLDSTIRNWRYWS